MMMEQKNVTELIKEATEHSDGSMRAKRNLVMIHRNTTKIYFLGDHKKPS